MNNPLQVFLASLRNAIPNVEAKVDEPLDPDGLWFLDLSLEGPEVTVEWSPRRGFGVSASEAEYGELPDEVYLKEPETSARVVQLLRSRERTSPRTR